VRFLEAGVRPARTLEIFPLFPATLIDVYGPRHATVNYGFLYVSQVIGAPIAALIRETTGSWTRCSSRSLSSGSCRDRHYDRAGASTCSVDSEGD